MSEQVVRDATAATAAEEPADAGEDGLVLDDLLVEEVSIDGMCGVY